VASKYLCDIEVMSNIITYKYRIKDSNAAKVLNRMAGACNYVWNYANETSALAWKRDHRWLSGFDINNLTTGTSKELGIHGQTIQAVVEEHAKNRGQYKKSKLRWRSGKKSLGWIPFKEKCVQIEGDIVCYLGHKFRFWNSRDLPGRVHTGCFVQDARRRWYVCFKVEAPEVEQTKTGTEVGIDLGFKTQITCSDGVKYERENQTRKYAEKLAVAQRAKQKKRVKNIYAKMKNVRNDFNHKASSELVKRHELIKVGNVSSKAMVARKKGWAKSATDSSWSSFKSMLLYKARRHGVEYQEVNEAWSSVTCSDCGLRTGPRGLSSLGVRAWQCSNCGASHDRDVNAAQNICRVRVGSPTSVRES